MEFGKILITISVNVLEALYKLLKSYDLQEPYYFY